MSSVEVFLDLYRQLEEDLKIYYSGKKLRFSSPVFEFMNVDGKKYYDELDVCRDIRNVLSHHSSIDGEYPVIPSDSVIEALREIIGVVENPVTALKIATPTEDLVTASYADSVPSVLYKMQERGFSHVPVMNGGMLSGVFSVGAVFEFVKRTPGLVVDESVTLGDLRDFLPAGAHKWEKYLFCTGNTVLNDVADMFKSSGPKQKRVAAVFVTKTENTHSELKGMITPWDVLKAQIE